MIDIIIEYLNFVGSGLYLASTTMFAYLFFKLINAKDGIGLVFLKCLTFCLSLGSLIIFTVRMCTQYGHMDMATSRAIATFNPLLMVGVGLYLNYLFNNSGNKIPRIIRRNVKDSNNILEIKTDVKEANKTLKVIKLEIKEIKK
jgi:hypothetical protein